MSLVSAFGLGVWNAWIFIGSTLLVTFLSILLMTKKGASDGLGSYSSGSTNYQRNLSFLETSPVSNGSIAVFGVNIASALWVFLLLTIILGVGVNRPYLVKVEEAHCLGHYGTPYREYMKRTSRWIGIPKSQEKMIV